MAKKRHHRHRRKGPDRVAIMAIHTLERDKEIPTMATIADLLAGAQALAPLSDDLATKQSASHDALQAVADTTSAQNALVQQAQAAAAVAINAAQATADEDVAATTAATAALDAQIDAIVAMAQALKQ